MGRKGRPMGKQELPSIWYEDVNLRRIPSLMIVMGISLTAMLLFEGLALTNQLDLFKWLTWLFAAMSMVPGYMVMVMLIRLIHLARKRRKEKREEKRQAIM